MGGGGGAMTQRNTEGGTEMASPVPRGTHHILDTHNSQRRQKTYGCVCVCVGGGDITFDEKGDVAQLTVGVRLLHMH